MNEKQEFLKKLREALVERDISQTDIDPYIERFDRYFERMQSDPDRNNLELLSDIDRIADNIANQIAERYESINALAEQTMAQKIVEDKSQAQGELTENESDLSGSGSYEPSAAASIVNESATGDGGESASTNSGEASDADVLQSASVEGSDVQIMFAPSDSSKPEEEQVSLTVDEGRSDRALPTAQYDSALIERTLKPTEAEDAPPAEYIDEDEAPTGTLFWVLFAVSLPILIPLAAAGCAVFLAVWLALAALMVASVLVLIAGAGAGAALSLVGVIYGITQIFISLPVGLYELGLGIIIGGCVMFAGIILYNFAIRLIPLLMLLLGRLFRFICKRIKRLFIFLRRECARL